MGILEKTQCFERMWRSDVNMCTYELYSRHCELDHENTWARLRDFAPISWNAYWIRSKEQCLKRYINFRKLLLRKKKNSKRVILLD